MSDPKARILDAAMECFASKGYAATTMADIEAAAGFVPRTGGTYRHFRSKQAILEAAIDSHLAANHDALEPAPTSFADAARSALALLDEQHRLMRVLFRDLDQFPDLMARVVDQLIQRTYRLVADRTSAVAPSVDAEAVAAIMIGALVNYKVIEAMTGARPGDVSEERLVATWAHIYEQTVIAGAS